LLGITQSALTVSLVGYSAKMIQINKSLVSKARDLPDPEKLTLVNILLQDLDQPDPAIDKAWAREAKKRLRSIKSGKMKTHDYASVMAKLRK
jgi:hypothetical protein